MKTIRTRMLIVFTAAAIVISFFMHWKDIEQGYRDGYYSTSSTNR